MKNKQPKPRFNIGDTVYFFEDSDNSKISSDKIMKVVHEELGGQIYYSYFLEYKIINSTSTTLVASSEHILFKSEKELILNALKNKKKNLEWFKKRFPIEVKCDEKQILKLEKMLESLNENKNTKITS